MHVISSNKHCDQISYFKLYIYRVNHTEKRTLYTIMGLSICNWIFEVKKKTFSIFCAFSNITKPIQLEYSI